MTETPGKDTEAAARRKQARRTVLVLGLMVAGVALAWSGGKLVESWLTASHGSNPAGGTSGRRGAGPEKDVPFDLKAPLMGTGLVPFTGDPAGVAPPAGAHRVSGYQRRTDQDVESQVRYRMPGPADAVADHYVKALTSQGHEKLKDASVGGRRTIVFGKRDGWVTVSLRKAVQNAKMVVVVVVATAPVAPSKDSKR